MKSKLSEHVFKKGKFITPINSIPQMYELPNGQSWMYGRLPEYLWIGLVFRKYGREVGLNKLYKIILELHKIAPESITARLSSILALSSEKQKSFYKIVIEQVGIDTLSPLTVILTVSTYPEFAEAFYSDTYNIEERCNILTETMRGLMDHQSHKSTDIRFVVLYHYLLSGKLHLREQEIEMLVKYPSMSHDDELMRMVRPMVRSTEMMLLQIEKIEDKYIKNFWERISEMTECATFSINFPSENRKIDDYMEKLHEIFAYLSELFVTTSPLDEKMSVLLGIATYSYKRLQEIYQYSLYNTISGRGTVRTLIENYIMMKYLVKNESSHENIWRDFKLYGLGLYKLVLTRYRETPTSDESHFDAGLIEALVNEFKEEEFINMDTKYFDNQNIRSKAADVDEKQLYGLYYDYDSSFEHGLWGAIRESSMLKCNNPAHQYHCIPDIDNKNTMKSVLPDCIMVMSKILLFLDDMYTLPKQLFNEVINFEIKPIK